MKQGRFSLCREMREVTTASRVHHKVIRRSISLFGKVAECMLNITSNMLEWLIGGVCVELYKAGKNWKGHYWITTLRRPAYVLL